MEDAIAQYTSIYVAGEMGIEIPVRHQPCLAFYYKNLLEALTGIGTGIDTAQLQHKKQVIDAALALHQNYVQDDAFKALCAVGGLEVAAMVGRVYSLCAVGLADGGWFYQQCCCISCSARILKSENGCCLGINHNMTSSLIRSIRCTSLAASKFTLR